MYNHFYGLTFNPFDKSSPVKTAFQSKDHLEMQNRLSFLKDTRGMSLNLLVWGNLCPALFCRKSEPKPLSNGLYLSFNHKRYGILSTVMHAAGS